VLAQVWLFIVAPLIGAGIAGYLFKSGILAADDVIPDRGGAKSDVAPAAHRASGSSIEPRAEPPKRAGSAPRRLR